MNIFTYALFTYAITAVISLVTIGVVLCVNKIVNQSEKKTGE